MLSPSVMNDDTAIKRPIENHHPVMPIIPAEDGNVGDAYVNHALVLRRLAIRKFHVPACDVDALVHDVFINYLNTAHRSRPVDLRAYLISAICNASRNYWRRKRCEERIFSPDDLSDSGSEIAALGIDTFREVADTLAVASILARLETRCRDVLKRYYLEEEDTSSIAEAIRTTCTNVNYLMHVCRKRARAAYESIIDRK